MLPPVRNKWVYYLESTTLTPELVWDHYSIFYLQEWIYVLQYTIWNVINQILLKYTLRFWYTCWYILRETIIWSWDIIPILTMNPYLTSWDSLWLILLTNWWCSLISSGRNVQILSEVQDHIFCLIMVYQLITAHMF